MGRIDTAWGRAIGLLPDLDHALVLVGRSDLMANVSVVLHGQGGMPRALRTIHGGSIVEALDGISSWLWEYSPGVSGGETGGEG